MPESVIPLRMRGKPRHDRLPEPAQAGREADHLVALHAGVDEQRAVRTLHDHGVAPAEPAPVGLYTRCDLAQRGGFDLLAKCNYPD